MQLNLRLPGDTRPTSWWFSLAAWALGWACLLLLDARIDLANKALVLVLTAAVAAIRSGPWISMVAAAAAVLAFNFVFVPPRGSFTVDLDQHALLLLAMLSVSWIVTLLMTRLRWHSAEAKAHARRSDQLQQLGATLRASDDLASQAAALQEALTSMAGHTTALLLLAAHGSSVQTPSDQSTTLIGLTSADETAGLHLCLHDGRAMGPGTGRHAEQAAWYLPLRARQRTHGAALVRLASLDPQPEGLLEHAQALCDQMGAAMEHASVVRAAAEAREQAQAHALRNTLLAAIAHDHRTPLATILGAASAMHDQAERLSPAQRQKLAATIVDEASQLSRLTDNSLQLARLGTVGLALQREWESVEELVGTALRRVRQRDPGRRVKARVEPGLPLLRCDAVLMVQLLDNLIDNALAYGGSEAPVEVVARQVGDSLQVAVRDRGPGVPLGLRHTIFESFQRGPAPQGATSAEADADAVEPHRRRGAGLGLALCRAIAHAHGGDLRLRPRAHGGASFELSLPVEAMPDEAGAPAQKEKPP